jgi:Reverse transcriptase (RNA-dependent DNA polymerase)
MVIKKLGYQQSNTYHTMFIRRKEEKICILVMYVDDIVLTDNDPTEMKMIKTSLGTEFEMKDLGELCYFLGIEVARSKKGVVLSQQKYILDLLNDMGMLGCRPASTPIDPNHKLIRGIGDQVVEDSTSTW